MSDFVIPWTASRPWDFPGKSTGVGCHFLLQGVFPTQGWNLGLPHCRQMLYHLSYQRSHVTYVRPPKRSYGLWVSKGTQSTSATQTGGNWKNKQSNSFSIFSFDLLVPSCLQPNQRLEVKGSQFTQSIKVSLLEPRVQKDCCQSLSHVQLCNPMDCRLPGSSIHGISRQEYWSGLSFPSPGDLSDPGIEPGYPALQADALPFEPPGKPKEKVRK